MNTGDVVIFNEAEYYVTERLSGIGWLILQPVKGGPITKALISDCSVKPVPVPPAPAQENKSDDELWDEVYGTWVGP